MRAIVGREQLRRELARLARIATTKGTPSVGGTILITSESGRLRLASTNLEVSIVCRITCDIEDEGAVVVPARMFAEFVSDLPGDTVWLDLSPDAPVLRVRAAHGDSTVEATIRGVSADDFPSLPNAAEAQTRGATITVAPDLLRDLIEGTAFAAATADEGQPILAGAQLLVTAGRLTLCATNGRRIALYSSDIVGMSENQVAAIVPTRALSEMARAASEAQEPISLTLTTNQNQLLCQTSAIEVWSQLLNGPFPDCQGRIPQRYQTRTVVERERLLELLTTRCITGLRG